MSNKNPLVAPFSSRCLAYGTGFVPLAKPYVICLCASGQVFRIRTHFVSLRLVSAPLHNCGDETFPAGTTPPSQWTMCPNVFMVMFTLTIIFGQCLSRLLAPRHSKSSRKLLGILLTHDFIFSLKKKTNDNEAMLIINWAFLLHIIVIQQFYELYIQSDK